MRCRPDTKPLGGDGSEEVVVMPPTFVEMTDEQFDRATTILARMIGRLIAEIERETNGRHRKAA